MRGIFRGAIAAAPVVMLVVTAGPAVAQQDKALEVTPAELFQGFVSEGAAAGQRSAAQSRRIYHVLLRPGAYGHARLRPFLEQLKDVAVNHPAERLAAEAAYALSIPGTRAVDAPAPGTVERLIEVYNRTQHGVVRAVVVGSMIDQSEREAAIPFLESVATTPRNATGPDLAQRLAIYALASMGDAGRQVLRRLHERRAIRDPEARYQLEVIARNGYRLDD